MNTLRWSAAFALLWLAILVALCSSCTPPAYPPLPSDQQLTVDATLAGWRAAGLPDPGDCLDSAVVRWARDVAEFARRCGVPVTYAAACTTQETEQRGMRVWARPVALLRPGQALFDSTGGPAVHEWLHVCSARVLGDADPGHTDARVWMGAGGEESAQGRARAMLGGTRVDP